MEKIFIKEKENKQKKKKEEKIKSPSLSKRLKNFTVSAIKHIAKGMPTCTQEEIDERLEICRGCKWFRGGSCRKCGCACNNNKKFLNYKSFVSLSIFFLISNYIFNHN